ncbi:MAG: DUF2807 domain-containing protein, partial [Planctomycetota bacterium]
DNSVAEIEELSEENFTLFVSDSARVSAKGESTNAKISVEDSGRVDAKEFVVQRLMVQASDHAAVVVQAQEELAGRTDESARLQYIGIPDALTLKTKENSTACNVMLSEAMSNKPDWLQSPK